MAQAFYPSIQEAKAGIFLSSKAAWFSELVPEQQELLRETLSKRVEVEASRETEAKSRWKSSEDKQVLRNVPLDR